MDLILITIIATQELRDAFANSSVGSFCLIMRLAMRSILRNRYSQNSAFMFATTIRARCIGDVMLLWLCRWDVRSTCREHDHAVDGHAVARRLRTYVCPICYDWMMVGARGWGHAWMGFLVDVQQVFRIVSFITSYASVTPQSNTAPDRSRTCRKMSTWLCWENKED